MKIKERKKDLINRGCGEVNVDERMWNAST